MPGSPQASRAFDIPIYFTSAEPCCDIDERTLTTWPDLRDPSTTPLNFTKSINLALSERGINAMRHAGQPKLIDHVMGATIPMRGRMIHGKRANGRLYEEGQDYDAHGRVGILLSLGRSASTDTRRTSSQSTAAASTSDSLTF